MPRGAAKKRKNCFELLISLHYFIFTDSSVYSHLPLNPSIESFISVIVISSFSISFSPLLKDFLYLYRHFHFPHTLFSSVSPILPLVI